MEKTIFEQIKKQNGESFAKTIRQYDNGIFDIPHIVQIVQYAGDNAEPILQFLHSLKNRDIQSQPSNQDPFALLKQAGYNAYLADTFEKQNSIQKYFTRKERLCTFKDPQRFKDFYIINAIREDIETIHRKDFIGKEERQDKYGTSVLSIQIFKNGGFISIKNRYNHTVENCDNTFHSNPDEIIPGLSEALKKYFNIDFYKSKLSIPDNFIFMNGRLFKYHMETNGVFYSSNFYIKGNEFHLLNKNHEFMLGQCILNIKNRTIFNPSAYTKPNRPILFDQQIDTSENLQILLAHEFKQKKIQVLKTGKNSYQIYADGTPIISTKNGQITSLCLTKPRVFNNEFSPAGCYRSLEELIMPNLLQVGNNFGYGVKNLSVFIAPRLKVIGNNFLYDNFGLKKLHLPNVIKIGNNFLRNNKILEEFYAPRLTSIKDYFLGNNLKLKTLYLPNLTRVRHSFLETNPSLTSFTAPNLKTIGNSFLENNTSLAEISLENLLSVGDYFLFKNEVLSQINTPSLRTTGINFLTHNQNLQQIRFQNLQNFNLSESLIFNQKIKSIKIQNKEYVTVGNKIIRRLRHSIFDFFNHIENCR